jgi:hypothetical protein
MRIGDWRFDRPNFVRNHQTFEVITGGAGRAAAKEDDWNG